jgi:predicted phosphodiesterase
MPEDWLFPPDPHPYAGLLFIGDPHVAASPPGYRLDDYAQATLGKLAVALETAREHNLLAIILGDLFHLPRNNPNSLLVALIELFRHSLPFVLVGNHDKHEARLTRDVSLAVIQAADVIRLIDRAGPVCSLQVAEWRVLLGASPDWTPLPIQVDKGAHDLVIWLTHHDLGFPGYDAARVPLKEIPGVDMVVNGHLHTPKPPRQCGGTTWFNPGGISRLTLSPHTRDLTPSVFIWKPPDRELAPVPLPHRPFSEIFPELTGQDEQSSEQDPESLFIKGLENLLIRKTTEGVGLKTFLEANLIPDDPIDIYILDLYEEVIREKK